MVFPNCYDVIAGFGSCLPAVRHVYCSYQGNCYLFIYFDGLWILPFLDCVQFTWEERFFLASYVFTLCAIWSSKFKLVLCFFWKSFKAVLELGKYFCNLHNAYWIRDERWNSAALGSLCLVISKGESPPLKLIRCVKYSIKWAPDYVGVFYFQLIREINRVFLPILWNFHFFMHSMHSG